MARICPETGCSVLYPECLECELRAECRNGIDRRKDKPAYATEPRSADKVTDKP